jgi:hypothetical protein
MTKEKYTVILEYPRWATNGNIETRCSVHAAESWDSSVKMAQNQAHSVNPHIKAGEMSVLFVLKGDLLDSIEYVLGD